MGSPQTILVPFLSGHPSQGLIWTSWHPAPFVPAIFVPCPSLPVTCPCPSLPILARPCPCPQLSLPSSSIVLAHNSWIGHPGFLTRSPLGGVGQLGLPTSHPQSSDLDFYSLANLPSFPAHNPTGGRGDLDPPSLGSPPPHCPCL